MRFNTVTVTLVCLSGTYALLSTPDDLTQLASQDGGGVRIMAKDTYDDLTSWPSRGSQDDLERRLGQRVLQSGIMDWPARGSSEDRDQRGGHQILPDDASGTDWPERGSQEDNRHKQGPDHDYDGTATFVPDWNNPHVNILNNLREHAKKFVKFFGPKPVQELFGLTKRLVTGRHEFRPPNFEAGDQRGPCPGLNALANHNYIPRSGVVNTFQVIFAINRVYGVSVDLGAVLSALSTVWAGIPVSINPRWSINGTTPLVSYPFHGFLGAVGEPRGITAGHNLLESDSSNTRADVYETGKVGDNYRLRLSRWLEWYNMSPDPVGNYNWWVMSKRGVKAFEDSKRDNPFFWRGPVSGLIIANGVLTLPPALMSNHSILGLNPVGHLTKNIIKSFYGIYGEEPNFEYREGWERIPNNWYRRPVDYTLAEFLLGGQAMATMHPQLFSLGGNIGRVNTFTGLDLSDLFGGAFHSYNLLRGNASICVGLQVLKTLTPSPFSSVYANFVVPLKLIEEAINPLFKVMNCPVFEDLSKGGTTAWDAIKGRFPGAKMGPFPY
ncbi:hypothetical protein L249_3301 [Ophiocordyceps polyrhachis-furcata BCC 54312]|uniref:Heme haloperoxidase family profile domain-containing protein n=1 Tax=Ophiocordyceps polyrhachis-furcata BCC 54312 TaxID=1330021 RepID=A0A367LSU6_9HYPO|nr:hypothetical protein L249_3301 [Ophiocordyceps polyrhachis-furcata BCC 54312]